MTNNRSQPTGARTREFLGPRRSAPVSDGVRQNARKQLLSVDKYTGVPQGNRGFYTSPGRGVEGESSN